MHTSQVSRSGSSATSGIPTNGSGAAAVLAAGIGALSLALIAIAADKITAFGRLMIFYRPTGPLSGVTTSAIVVWLAIWAILDWRWRNRSVPLGTIGRIAVLLLVVGLLLTFPPVADLF